MGCVSQRVWSGAVLVLVASGCAERDDLSGPGGPDVVAPLQARWTAGPVDGFALPTPDDNNLATPFQYSSVPIGDWIPHRVTVTGFLNFTVNSQYTECSGSPPPQLPGGWTTIGPWGFPEPTRPWGAAIRLDSTWLSIVPSDPGASSIVAYVQTGTRGPSAWAGRSPGVSACGSRTMPYAPAYHVQGTQTVTIEALEPPVAEPDERHVAWGDTVRFTVQVPWTSNFYVSAGWQWVPDTTTNNSTVLSTCYRATTCDVVVRERGHVKIEYVVAEGMWLVAESPVIQVEDGRVRIGRSPVASPCGQRAPGARERRCLTAPSSLRLTALRVPAAINTTARWRPVGWARPAWRP